MPKKETIATEETDGVDIAVTDETKQEAATAPLEEQPKPLTFKVKLEAVPDKEAASGFSYMSGSRYEHWSLEHHGYEVEFNDLEIARSFMTAALETGSLEIASDSPTKLKQ